MVRCRRRRRNQARSPPYMEEKAFLSSPPPPRACTLFSLPIMFAPDRPQKARACLDSASVRLSVRPSVKSFEFLIRRGVERVEHAEDDDD